MKKFAVVSCTQTDKGDGFIVKFQHQSDKTADLGFATKTQKHQETYYIKLDTAVDVDSEHELNLDLFDIKERPFTTDEGETVQLKWLFLK